MHRMDPPEAEGWEAMLEHFDVAVAEIGSLPRNADQWTFTPDFGGRRVVIRSWGGRARIDDAEDGSDLSDRLPELRALGRDLGAEPVALDGQLAGSELDRRLAATGASATRRLSTQYPVAFIATDVLWHNGHDVRPLSTADRCEILDALAIAGPAWQAAPAHVGEGKALREAAKAQGLPGVIAKHLDAAYGADWRYLPT